MMKSSRPVVIVGVYAVVSALWILFSDKAVGIMFSGSPETLTLASMLKGWFYVTVISALLWGMLARHHRLIDKQTQALRESEERLNLALTAVSDGLWDWRVNTGEVYFSPRWFTMLGYQPDELPSSYKTWQLLVHPDDLPGAETILATHFHSGRPFETELRMRAKDGSWRWVLTRGKLVERTPDGSPGRILGTHVDINDRKLDQQAAQESADKYRRLLESLMDGYALVDMSGRVKECNAVFKAMLGYTDQELAAATYEDFTPAKWHALEAAILRDQVLPRGYSDVYEKQYRRKDGVVFPVELRTNLIRDNDGQPQGMWGIIRDITTRKQTEEGLRKALTINQMILLHSPMAVAVYESGGRCVMANEQTAATLGCSLDNVLAQNFRKLDSWRSCGLLDLALAALASGEPKAQDVALVSDSGRQLNLAATMARFEVGEVAYLLFIGMEITERLRLQEAMIQTEKMMSVGGLAAGLAHEINNPLGGILQGAQAVLRRLSAQSEVNREVAQQVGCPIEALTAYLERREVPLLMEGVRTSAVQAAKIVDNILEFSRKSAAGRIHADVHALLDHALAVCAADYVLKERFAFDSIEIVKEYDSTIPPLPCTPTQIQQVFANILRNACQALAGRVAAKAAPRITLRTSLSDNSVRVEIADNGPGMPEEVRRKAFEPFFTTKAPGDGTGLGLSVAYFIVVNHHGGRINVQAEPGGGSRFVVELPCEACELPLTPEQPPTT